MTIWLRSQGASGEKVVAEVPVVTPFFHSPQHRVVIIAVRGHIGEAHAGTGGSGRAHGTPQEGHGLGTGAAAVGIKAGGGNAGGDALVHRPQDGVVVVIPGLHILEGRLPGDGGKAGLDGHGPGGHGEGILPVAQGDEIEGLAICIHDGDLAQSEAAVGGDGDGHLGAGHGRSPVRAHLAAGRGLRDDGIAFSAGGDGRQRIIAPRRPDGDAGIRRRIAKGVRGIPEDLHAALAQRPGALSLDPELEGQNSHAGIQRFRTGAGPVDEDALHRAVRVIIQRGGGKNLPLLPLAADSINAEAVFHIAEMVGIKTNIVLHGIEIKAPAAGLGEGELDGDGIPHRRRAVRFQGKGVIIGRSPRRSAQNQAKRSRSKERNDFFHNTLHDIGRQALSRLSAGLGGTLTDRRRSGPHSGTG